MRIGFPKIKKLALGLTIGTLGLVPLSQPSLAQELTASMPAANGWANSGFLGWHSWFQRSAPVRPSTSAVRPRTTAPSMSNSTFQEKWRADRKMSGRAFRR